MAILDYIKTGHDSINEICTRTRRDTHVYILDKNEEEIIGFKINEFLITIEGKNVSFGNQLPTPVIKRLELNFYYPLQTMAYEKRIMIEFSDVLITETIDYNSSKTLIKWITDLDLVPRNFNLIIREFDYKGGLQGSSKFINCVVLEDEFINETYNLERRIFIDFSRELLNWDFRHLLK